MSQHDHLTYFARFLTMTTSLSTTSIPQWFQKTISLKAHSRGCHLITNQLLAEIHQEMKSLRIGIAQFFVQHTSASLTINENYDSDVPLDFEDSLNRLAPENSKLYR